MPSGPAAMNVLAYGTVFDSEIPLVGFEPSDRRADINIVFGQVPLNILRPTTHGMFWSATSSEVLFNVPSLMRVHVTNGRRITVEPLGGEASTPDIASLITGAPLAAALMQRGEMILHGSAALIEGGALVVTGLNGSGKSSVVSALSSLGMPIVCDNLAVMTPAACIANSHDVTGDDRWFVQSGPSIVKLWHDMAVALGRPVDTAVRVSAEVNKFCFDVTAMHSPVPVRAVVHLKRAAVSHPELDRLSDAEATVAVMRGHFRNKIARVSRPQALTDSAALAQSVPVYSCRRPDGVTDPRYLAQFILGGVL